MNHIHVKNLEKYHPGYRDRELKWAKIYFSLVDGDPDFELIENEVDKWRFIAILCLELRAQCPLPDSKAYWTRKGFDLRKRPMSATLKMLQPFVDVVTGEDEDVSQDRYTEKIREEKKREEKRVEGRPQSIDDVKQYFVELRMKDEAVSFYDHFESNGWRVSGRTPMKDWRATARNWVRRAVERFGKKLDPIPKAARQAVEHETEVCDRCEAVILKGQPCPDCMQRGVQ